MAGAIELQQQLLASQNRDGGWGYQNGSSWTEPTALAMLALKGARESRQRAVEWLVRHQNTDGGWSPNPVVKPSTAVTSWAVLALSRDLDQSNELRSAVAWVAKEIYPDQSFIERRWHQMLGIEAPKAPGSSPWFPGTAGWVVPTAMSILALLHAGRTGDQSLQPLITHAQNYLLSRRCSDGGWNHGGSKTRSEDATSYPETTGLALLALSHVTSADLAVPIQLAEAALCCPPSMEALAWLQMGLLAHGRPIEDPSIELPCRNNRDIALRLLSLATRGGANPLLAEA